MFRVIVGLFLLIHTSVLAQKSLPKYTLEASVFYGNTLEHSVDIAHLLTEHPTGFLVSWSKILNPEKYASFKNNYPELGLSFSYHQSHVEALGNNSSLYGHIHWYAFSRLLQFKLAQGITYVDNPYHPDKNYRNNAYGSKFLAATRFELNFVKENIWEGLGVQTGLGVVHYSNGGIKKPNTSANTVYAHVGLRYNWGEVQIPKQMEQEWVSAQEFSGIRYEAILRGGINQSGVGTPSRGFFVLGGALGKRWSYRSGWHAGAELFYSPFLKDHIEFRSIAYPESGYSGTEDFKRVGVYGGYDFYFSDTLSFFVNLGFYPYWPIPYESRVYNRAGFKYQLEESPWLVMFNVRAHSSKAESMEFGLGYKF